MNMNNIRNVIGKGKEKLFTGQMEEKKKESICPADMHELSLEEIHEREWLMLKRLSELCDRYGLRYYLCGGTLLGAIRHKDFIPWDDDVDVLMPRPDYERLQNIVRGQPFFPDYEFHSFTLGNLDDPMCKIFDLNTQVDKEWINDRYDHYLWIDIFPMDGVGPDMAELEKTYKKVHTARKLLRFMKARNGTGKNGIKAMIKPLLKPLVLLALGKKRTVRYIEGLAKRYPFEESKKVAGIVYGYGTCEVMDREAYVRSVRVPFGRAEFSAPSCYDEYLTALFGNYMEFPPEDKRQVHFMKVYGK